MAADETETPHGTDAGRREGSCTCTGAIPENVEEVDRLILAHTPLREIASRVPGTSRSALGRHRKHVGGLLVRAVARIVAPRIEAAEIEAYEDSLLSKVSRLEADARRIGLRAESEGDLRAALVANAGLLNVVKLLHELLPASAAPERVVVEFNYSDVETRRFAERGGVATPSTTQSRASSIPEDIEVSQPNVERDLGPVDPGSVRVEEPVSAVAEPAPGALGPLNLNLGNYRTGALRGDDRDD